MGCEWNLLHWLLAIATVPVVMALGVLTWMLWNMLRGNAVREKELGDKFIEFHCDFDSWNDIDAAIDKARIPRAHQWKVTHEGMQYMDSRCARCGATKRETWD